MSAAHTPVGWDTAYPGSMSERNDGYFLRRDDHKSLAAALIELIDSRDHEIEDLRDGIQSYRRLLVAAPKLLDAAQAALLCICELSPTQARAEVAQMLTEAIEKANGAES